MESGWSIPGSDGAPILGNAHEPEGTPRGVILLAHGFKGYKDYGMFPALARAAAGAGLIAHRFNFSHSGMTNRIDTFERPDLFERDTWSRQVHDLGEVARAVRAGRLAGAGRPCVIFGHSRGGATALLAAGRGADEADFPAPAGVITAAAPSRCNTLEPAQAAALRERGFLESPSSRTGQVLRVGAAFLAEQEQDPRGHDLAAVAARIRCPVLIVHGSDDPTVPVACAAELHRAIGDRARVLVIPGADHVFGAPNPMPADAEPGPALQTLIDGMIAFATERCESAATP